MITKIYAGQTLGKYLNDEGLLPPECADVELFVPSDGLLQLKYTVNVTDEDLGKIRRALERLEESESS